MNGDINIPAGSAIYAAGELGLQISGAGVTTLGSNNAAGSLAFKAGGASQLTIATTGRATFAGAVEMDGALDHDGTTVGFYGTVPTAQQTGVAVTAAAIHAALVTLGLITA